MALGHSMPKTLTFGDFEHFCILVKSDGNTHKAAANIINTYYTFNSLFIFHLKCITTCIIQQKWCNASEICLKLDTNTLKGFFSKPIIRTFDNFGKTTVLDVFKILI
jgi:hypothetical protein